MFFLTTSKRKWNFNKRETFRVKQRGLCIVYTLRHPETLTVPNKLGLGKKSLSGERITFIIYFNLIKN